MSSLLLLIALLAPFNLFALGHDVGHALDAFEGDNEAWFNDPNRSVDYCVVGAEGFGVSETELSQYVRDAFAKWDAYIKKKNIDGLGTIPRKVACGANTDLIIYFGAPPNLIKAYISPDTYAYTKKTSEEPKSHWGRGVLWVRRPHEGENDFRKPGELRSLITHEIGHLLGNPHIEGTIMDRNLIVARLTGEKPRYKEDEIDIYRELAVSESGKGISDVFTFQVPAHAKLFDVIVEELTGQKPCCDGSRSISLSRRGGWAYGWQTLSFATPKKSYDFAIPRSWDRPFTGYFSYSEYKHDDYPSGRPFSRLLPNSWVGTYSGHDSHVSFIGLPTKKGGFMTFIIEYNMAYGEGVDASDVLEGVDPNTGYPIVLSVIYRGKRSFIAAFRP